MNSMDSSDANQAEWQADCTPQHNHSKMQAEDSHLKIIITHTKLWSQYYKAFKVHNTGFSNPSKPTDI